MKAFKICQSAEVAEKNARELQMSQKYKVPPLLGYHQLSHARNLQHLFHAIGVVASSTQPKIAVSKLQSVTIAGRRAPLQKYVAASTSTDSISRVLVPVRQPSQVELIIQPVEFSEWAAPIIPVVKTDGSIRICGDYRVTVNQPAKLDTNPLPRAHDLFASLAGGKTFTTLDLAHVYQQIPLDEDSKKLVCINTHKGLYAYNRLECHLHPRFFSAPWKAFYMGSIKYQCTWITFRLREGQMKNTSRD